ncbi:MAG: PAS domain S-box protein [Candidatus Acidiferrum sp.]
MRSRKFPSFLVITALLILGLQILNIVFLGPGTLGSLIGNVLEISCSFLAAGMCFRAARKDPGFSRAFWSIVGFGIAMWGVANFGWAYYELVLHTLPAPGNIIRFLFDSQGMLFVMAIFLDQEKTNAEVEPEEALDFVQIGILFFLIYFGMYYLPSLSFSPREALEREMWVVTLGNAGIIFLALLRWLRGRLPQVRRLYGGLALFLTILSLGAISAEFIPVVNELPTGTWFDLTWSIPLLYGAFWAATWEPNGGSARANHERLKSLPEIFFTNGMFVFVPLIIVFQVAQLGPGWRVLRFGLLLVSFVCYAARIGLTQYRQQKDEETVQRQSQAMDSSIDGIGILNEKGIHVYANSALARILGFESADRIVGKPWRAVYAFQEMDDLEPQVRLSLAKTRRWSAPMAMRRPDGSELPVEMTVATMPDGGTICVCRDHSEREEAEKAREEAEAKYRMLVEQVNAITYIAEIGISGQWYYVSPQVQNILGYSQEEWLLASSNWAQFIHPDDLPAVESAELASAKGEPFQAEFRIRRKDGRELWLSDTAVVVKGSGKHPVMEGIMVDITERKALETQLQQSRKMEAVGRLAGGIAHDFNNLLTIVTGYTELAMSRPTLSAELRGDIDRIENAANRAAALVRQLLAFSRKQVLQPKVLDLNSIVLNMDKLLRRLMDENIEMITRVQEDVGKVKADPAQVEQVIMNLVVNARDAMPEGGRLVIETSNVDLDSRYAEDHLAVRSGRYVMLAISDTGMGMDEETVAHIFEPFFTTKESGRGTGLGLSTVYGIVKQSGGYIWVYSEVGKGSTFKVYLPRVDAQLEETSRPEFPAQALRGTETILLVEDEEAVRELIHTVLTAQGYDVIPARDPEHAEKIVASYARDIHMLLTDVVMPGMSGRELAARVTARRPGIRVLYMSGYTDNVITSGGMLEKGLAFLQKPFSPGFLVQRVREVLSQTPAV